MDDARSSPSPPSPPSPSSSSAYSYGLLNYPLISAIVSFAVAQSIKFFMTWYFSAPSVVRRSRFSCEPVVAICRYRERRWDAKLLIGSGGMPSSHSATVTALAAAIGIQDGLGSSIFAAATIFASVVMHDAFGVRLHAGKQAEVLNQIVYELPADHPLSDTRPLRELIGHTPLQVIAGAFLGFVIATTGQLIKKVAGGT